MEASRSRRVWLVSPDPRAPGGVAEVARQILDSPLAGEWRLEARPTYAAGPAWRRVWSSITGVFRAVLGVLVSPPDLVHVKMASRGSFTRKLLVIAACRVRGVPVLLHIHGGGFDSFVREAPAPVRALAEWVVNREPFVLCLSESWRIRLEALFPGTRFETLVNPVETEKFRRNGSPAADSGAESPAPLVVFVGDLLERKGVADLLEAWRRVAAVRTTPRLVLAGRGDRAAWSSRAREAGLADRVDFAGFVAGERKRDLLHRATLFVLPSHVEGVPIALLEAMSSGLASVCTPVGGIPDVMTDRVEGRIVPTRDPAGLAQAILDVLDDPDTRARMGEAARRRVQAFDLNAYAERLGDYYRRALAARERHRP